MATLATAADLYAPDSGRSPDTATSIAVQDDGNILVGGYSLDGSYRAIVARYLG